MEKFITGSVGNESGSISTSPPEKSAGLSGRYDLTTETLSMSPVGKRSSGTTRLSGSVVGSTAPFSVVFE